MHAEKLKDMGNAHMHTHAHRHANTVNKVAMCSHGNSMSTCLIENTPHVRNLPLSLQSAVM